MFDWDKQEAEIYLYDQITKPGSGGIDAGVVQKALREIGPQPVTVRINSPGGDVDEGVAIFNALQRHGSTVTTVNDAIAASISNYIFMAGHERLVAKNSRSMIHEPWTVTAGNAEELRATADQLESAKSMMVSAYREKMPGDIEAMMKAETWLTADEAVKSQMATSLSPMPGADPVKIAAGVFNKTPVDLVETLAAGSRTPYRPKLRKLQHLTRKLSALR